MGLSCKICSPTWGTQLYHTGDKYICEGRPSISEELYGCFFYRLEIIVETDATELRSLNAMGIIRCQRGRAQVAALNCKHLTAKDKVDVVTIKNRKRSRSSSQASLT